MDVNDGGLPLDTPKFQSRNRVRQNTDNAVAPE